jgi:hypothetical protein
MRIQEIRSRLYAATPGNWVPYGIPYSDSVEDELGVISESGEFICATIHSGQTFSREHNVEADSLFIANAKSDIAYLLRAVEILSEAIL